MTISATEAAFEGFRITRQNPLAVVIWAAVWLVGLILALLSTLPFIAPFVQELIAAQGNPQSLSAPAQAAVSRAGLAVVPAMLLVQTVLSPALYRAVLRPEMKRFGYLRLGRDELRMLAVVVGLGLISMAMNLLSSALETAATQAVGIMLAMLVSTIFFVVSIFVSVRLSLVAPLTLLRGRIAFVEGWRASRPLFWPLLGVMVMSWAMALIVILLLVAIGWPLQVIVAGAAGAASGSAMISAVLMLLLIPFGAALVTTILWAPFAAICRNLQSPA